MFCNVMAVRLGLANSIRKKLTLSLGSWEINFLDMMERSRVKYCSEVALENNGYASDNSSGMKHAQSPFSVQLSTSVGFIRVWKALSSRI